MKLKIILSTLIIFIFLSSVSSFNAEHNEEFPTNGCETPDKSIQISVHEANFRFTIDGRENPDIQVEKNSCLEITFENKTDGIDHDFTVLDGSGKFEIIHMDAASGVTTHHLWSIPNGNITLDYFCEVPGHRAAGENGKFIIGEGTRTTTAPTRTSDSIADISSDGGLRVPGFEMVMVIPILFITFSTRKLLKNN